MNGKKSALNDKENELHTLLFTCEETTLSYQGQEIKTKIYPLSIPTLRNQAYTLTETQISLTI